MLLRTVFVLAAAASVALVAHAQTAPNCQEHHGDCGGCSTASATSSDPTVACLYCPSSARCLSTVNNGVNDTALADDQCDTSGVGFPVSAVDTCPGFNCTAYTGCDACTADAGCGWCSDIDGNGTSACLPGLGVPAVGEQCAAGWQWSTCSSCHEKTSCEDCYSIQEPDCLWCVRDQECRHGGDEASKLFNLGRSDEGVLVPYRPCYTASYCASPDEGVSRAALATDTMWLLLAAPLVFIMQSGFLGVETGSVRVGNTKAILLKNAADICVTAAMWYLLGFGFLGVFGDAKNANVFIGADGSLFAMSDSTEWATWFFQWTFCSTAITIISGAAAERIRFDAYLIFAAMIPTVIYPVSGHWMWSGDGGLFKWGVIDVAGSAVVHMVGGWAGLGVTVVLGPRAGRFDAKGRPVPIPGHSVGLAALGTLILWLGWFGFNAGSVPGLTVRGGAMAGHVAVTTLIAPSAAALATFFYYKLRFHEYSLYQVFNSILGGLVGITAGCAVITAEGAIVVGIISSIVYLLVDDVVLMLQIDDPVNAFAVHGVCGYLGMFAVGLFADEYLLREFYFAAGRIDHCTLLTSGVGKLPEDLEISDYYCPDYGAFVGGTGVLLGKQAAAGLAFIGWTLLWTVPIALVMRYFGVLRITKKQEKQGIDKSEHGGYAYNPLEIKVANWVAQKTNIQTT